MNTLKGKIVKIETAGDLSLVSIRLGENTFKSILVENPDTLPFLQPGNPVNVLFKETEVSIGKGIEGRISLQNRLECTIKEIEKGKLLSKLTLSNPVGEIVSIITTNAVRQLELEENGRVTALVKTNEIMLSAD